MFYTVYVPEVVNSQSLGLCQFFQCHSRYSSENDEIVFHAAFLFRFSFLAFGWFGFF